jgi:hypothetical protein
MDKVLKTVLKRQLPLLIAKYREELRKEEYCALDIDLFIRKLVSTIVL